MSHEFAVVRANHRAGAAIFEGSRLELLDWFSSRVISDNWEVYRKEDQTYISTDEFLDRYSSEGDAVNHPAHYNQYEGLEIIDLCEQMGFNLGNVVKYVARAGFKDPDNEVQDLMKAEFYLKREIQRVMRRKLREKN